MENLQHEHFKAQTISACLLPVDYPGRGILAGWSESGAAVLSYFITGRSSNSRNRIFEKTEDGILIKPFDASKVEDPRLIIYHPLRRRQNVFILTNGDQTDTIAEFMDKMPEEPFGSFVRALTTRTFEPDAPNFTPRISCLAEPEKGRYALSILKAADACGRTAQRFFYTYEKEVGIGHLIRTYLRNGNPLPSFTGEPVPLLLPDDASALADELWNSLDTENRISCYVAYIDPDTGTVEEKIINKNRV